MADEVATLEELIDFEGRSASGNATVTPSLKGVLVEVANSGLIRYGWKYLQSLILFYLNQVVSEYEAEGSIGRLHNDESSGMCQHRLRSLLQDQFPYEAPFTIQRIAELLLEPRKHYSRLDKWALAMEKLLLVFSTVQPEQNPPERPKLRDMRPVNEIPKALQVARLRRQLQQEELEVEARMKARDDAHQQAERNSTPETGFGLSSAVLAESTPHKPFEQEIPPELEEGFGNLNEAGIAAEIVHTENHDRSNLRVENAVLQQAATDQAPNLESLPDGLPSENAVPEQGALNHDEPMSS